MGEGREVFGENSRKYGLRFLFPKARISMPNIPHLLLLLAKRPSEVRNNIILVERIMELFHNFLPNFFGSAVLWREQSTHCLVISKLF